MFFRQGHYNTTVPWFQGILITADIVGRVVDLKALGLGDRVEVVDEAYAISFRVSENPLITIIIQAKQSWKKMVLQFRNKALLVSVNSKALVD
jgi:hypothetical protein